MQDSRRSPGLHRWDRLEYLSEVGVTFRTSLSPGPVFLTLQDPNSPRFLSPSSQFTVIRVINSDEGQTVRRCHRYLLGTGTLTQ